MTFIIVLFPAPRGPRTIMEREVACFSYFCSIIMTSDIKLKIRHAKRGNEKHLDLSGMGLTELPVDIT